MARRCIYMKSSDTAMIACNDGFRPVIFLLEATDEDAEFLKLMRITQAIWNRSMRKDVAMKKEDRMYRTNISTAKWWAYDIPGNIGWITYFACFAHLLRKGRYSDAARTAVPAGLMATGICELISERIHGLDRELPEKRLLRGFGALTLGGITGSIVGAAGLRTSSEKKTSALMSAGGALCAVFAGLLYRGYKKM